ncbi:SdpI family protein [Tenacibaculum sp. ZS6-P6]|uniref:SdpI family protein n=1 Tax=Tenacibaculum sp. ZS6-P6 TaxID=3447503 RepID=UPI003F972CEF
MSPFLYVLSVNGLLFLFSLIFHFFPPKKINSFYGYRTFRTMQNQKIWDFANGYFNKQFLLYSGISFLGAIALVFINPELSWQPMVLLVLCLAVSVVKTEQELNKFFDKEGKKLKK